MPADWAAQRVKGLSLGNAIINALTPKRKQTDITSLIEEFQYPKYGPGMMWERCQDLIEEAGGTVLMKTRVISINRSEDRVDSVTVANPDGSTTVHEVSHVISTMPMNQLVAAIDPPPPAPALAAGQDLHYRDFLTVALVVPEDRGFPDNWIYIHAQEVKVGRIQNFGSWSPFMVKDGRTCLGLEYFVFEGDDVWSMADEDLIALGTKELAHLGLVRPEDVEVG